MSVQCNIELFGLCGVGKSTVLADLVPVLLDLGGPQAPSIELPLAPAASAYRVELLRLLMQAGLRAPLAIGRLLTAPAGGYLPRKLAYRIAGLRKRKSSGWSLLIDSSVLQPFVSFVVEENLKDLTIPLVALFAAVPKPACAVYVRATVDTALERYIARQTTRGAAMTENGLKQRFRDGLAMCDWLCNACQEIGVPVLVLDVERQMQPDQLRRFAKRLLYHCHRDEPH